MDSSKKYISSLNDAATRLPELIANVDAATAELTQRLAELKAQGLIYATEHWKDGKYMTLLYPIQPGQPRQRKYVGNDPAKVKEAQEQIQRAKDYDSIDRQLQCINGTLSEALRHLTGATHTLSRAR